MFIAQALSSVKHVWTIVLSKNNRSCQSFLGETGLRSIFDLSHYKKQIGKEVLLRIESVFLGLTLNVKTFFENST